MLKTIIYASATVIAVGLAGYFGLTRLSSERPSNAAGRQVLNFKFQDIKIAGQVLTYEFFIRYYLV